MTADHLRGPLLGSLDLAKTAGFHLSELSPAKLWSAGFVPSGKIPLFPESDYTGDILVASRDGDLLARVKGSGSAQVLEKGSAKPWTLTVRGKSPTAAALLGRNDLLLTGFGNGTVLGTNFKTGQRIFQGSCGSHAVQFLVADTARARIVVHGRGGPLCVIDMTGRVPLPIIDLSADVVALSPDQPMLAAAGLTGIISLYEMDNMAEVARFEGHRGSIDALSFSLDSELLYSGGRTRSLESGLQQKLAGWLRNRGAAWSLL